MQGKMAEPTASSSVVLSTLTKYGEWMLLDGCQLGAEL
jgi:hypothetical protein